MKNGPASLLPPLQSIRFKRTGKTVHGQLKLFTKYLLYGISNVVVFHLKSIFLKACIYIIYLLEHMGEESYFFP